jgi:hypothetical protein
MWNEFSFAPQINDEKKQENGAWIKYLSRGNPLVNRCRWESDKWIRAATGEIKAKDQIPPFSLFMHAPIGSYHDQINPIRTKQCILVHNTLPRYKPTGIYQTMFLGNTVR